MSLFSPSSITVDLLRRRFIHIVCVLNVNGLIGHLIEQNTRTGALVGTVSDPTGAAAQGAARTEVSLADVAWAWVAKTYKQRTSM